MREIVVTIRCTDMANQFDVFTEATGDATTMEVVGLIEIAKKQYIESRQSPTINEHVPEDTSPRAPDGAPWYAHLDSPCGPECGHARSPVTYEPIAECGRPYPCEHAPDGGNHPKVAGT